MPELPEVEAARRGIADQLLRQPIVAHELVLPKLIIAPPGLGIDALSGRSIEDATRHGKYLTLWLGDLAAVVHLKLAGQIAARGEAIPGFAAGHPVPAYDAPLPHKSTHLTLTFENGARLYLTDIRHWARIQLLPTEDLPAFASGLRLGPDAIAPDFTREVFDERIHGRTMARLKPLLLDQSFVAGLGNIYVDEALHRARLHPERLARTMTDAEVDNLYDAIVDILAIAVPLGGASILNGKASPEHGAFPFVHGRQGQPCLACGAAIVKTRVDGRGTYLCEVCQVMRDEGTGIRDAPTGGAGNEPGP
ncbi:MAG: Fpg/Nei family DNA glycosylase, partial [Vicinamibacterales bacterium]